MKIFCINCGFEIKFADDELVHVESGSSLCNPIATHDSMMVAEALSDDEMKEWLESQKEETDGRPTKATAANREPKADSEVPNTKSVYSADSGRRDSEEGGTKEAEELEAVAASREYCD